VSERFTAEGVVYKIYPKTFGKDETFTIKIDGNRTWFRAGKNRYAGVAEPGNRITLEADPLPDGESARVVPGSVKLAAAPAPVAQNGTPSASYGGDRNNSIVYQSSLKAANAFLATAVAAGAVKLPAAQAAKLGALEAALDRYTAQFFNDVSTLGAVLRESENLGLGEAEKDEGEAGEDE